MTNRVYKIVSIWGALALVFGVSIASADNCSSIPSFQIWNNTVSGNPPSGDLSIESIASQNNVRIERNSQHYGGCYSYNIIDSESGQSLGEIPVSIRDQDSENYSPEELAQLSQRLGHMMQTDRSQLLELAQAKRKFLDDSLAISDESGLSTQSLFDNLSLSGNGVSIGFSGVECLANGSFQSPNPIEGSDVTIGHIEYRPDVQAYQSVYQSGQLTQSLASNDEAIAAIRSRIRQNSDNINSVMQNSDHQSEIPEIAAAASNTHSCAFSTAEFDRNLVRPLAWVSGLTFGRSPTVEATAGVNSGTTVTELEE